ncbi:hypothetical protein LIER_08191 [Lithospermum erythrorhizon]|uniref:Uncharacterized protein n=1 Tax=Lithospermum erythrorhizon TaxID=34254 RepID=A0AAV3PDT9_LITER
MMESDLSRALGNLNLEGEEMDEVYVPVMAYERVEEKYQFSLVGKVLTASGFNLPCWVQIWNLPPDYIDAEIEIAIGAHIGEVIEVDKRSIEQERGRYVGVEVKLHTGKPLKRRGVVPIRLSRVQVVYKYEKICEGAGNKYDPWILVHGERKLQNRRRDFRNEQEFWKQTGGEGDQDVLQRTKPTRYGRLEGDRTSNEIGDERRRREGDGRWGEIHQPMMEEEGNERRSGGTGKQHSSEVQERARNGENVLYDGGSREGGSERGSEGDFGKEMRKRRFNGDGLHDLNKDTIIELNEATYAPNHKREVGLHEINVVVEDLQDVYIKQGRVNKRVPAVFPMRGGKENIQTGIGQNMEDKHAENGLKRRKRDDELNEVAVETIIGDTHINMEPKTMFNMGQQDTQGARDRCRVIKGSTNKNKRGSKLKVGKGDKDVRQGQILATGEGLEQGYVNALGEDGKEILLKGKLL